jgi:hypothetical protein
MLENRSDCAMEKRGGEQRIQACALASRRLPAALRFVAPPTLRNRRNASGDEDVLLSDKGFLRGRWPCGLE